MTLALLIITFFILLAIELAYIPIARANNWTTERNNRTDGHPVTVVGGGLIFYVAMVLWSLTIGWIYDIQDIGSNFIVGLTMLAACSFADDLLQLRVWIRLIVQFTAVLFLCFQFSLFSHSTWVWMAFILCAIGFINGYNFMDGINGITAAYSLVVLSILLYINFKVIHFASGLMIMMALTAVVIFTFFNFRKVAIIFAGDIGAISMGYIICALMGYYILRTNELSALTMLSVYGVDTVMTILFRIKARENILRPHKKHVYQYLCYGWRINQLVIATSYALLQAGLSIGYLCMPTSQAKNAWFICTTVLLVVAYLILRHLCIRKILSREKSATVTAS